MKSAACAQGDTLSMLSESARRRRYSGRIRPIRPSSARRGRVTARSRVAAGSAGRRGMDGLRRSPVVRRLSGSTRAAGPRLSPAR